MHDLQKGEFWVAAKRNGMGCGICLAAGKDGSSCFPGLAAASSHLWLLPGSGLLAFAGLLLPVMVLSLLVVAAIKGESLR